jgi:hypothetical protein
VQEVTTTSASGDRVISNVSDPTLAIYLPEAGNANGTAVIYAAGGALRLHGYDSDGVKVAKRLNARGIAAYVLNYRTLQQAPSANTPPARPAGAPPPSAMARAAPAPRQELVIRNANANPEPGYAALTEVLQMAVADAHAEVIADAQPLAAARVIDVDHDCSHGHELARLPRPRDVTDRVAATAPGEDLLQRRALRVVGALVEIEDPGPG